jgi:hypothetical protein
MKLRRINSGMVLVSILCVLTGWAAWAGQGTPLREIRILKPAMHEGISENHELTLRVRELEAEMTGQEQETEEDAKGPTDEDKDLSAMINKYVEFGGVIEVEAGWSEDFESISESNVRLETAEFDFEAQVTEWATGTLVIEWDDEEDKLTVDEAFVTIGNTEKFPGFLQAGRFVAAFGISTGDPVADTLTISDPLTIEVFETQEDMVLLGIETGGFNTGAYVFNGETNENGGEDHIEQFRATVGYLMNKGNMSFDADVDIIRSVFDSDELTDAFPDALEANYAPGIAAHIKFRMGGFSVVTEYNGALKEVKFTSNGDAFSIEPKAWQVQAGYETEIDDKETYFAFGYSQTHELAEAFPKRRMLASIGRWFFENLLLSVEYARDGDYDESEGGSGESANAVTAQLTYEW